MNLRSRERKYIQLNFKLQNKLNHVLPFPASVIYEFIYLFLNQILVHEQ